MRAWLFDAYPSAEGMTLWFIDEDGRPHCLHRAYHPAFYAAGPRHVLARLEHALFHARIPVDCTPAIRRELFSGAELPVLRIAVDAPLEFPAAVRRAAKVPGVSLFTCDLSTPQLFFYETELFPLGLYEITSEDGVLRAAEPLSRVEDLEYELPPLTFLRMRLEGDPINPNHGWRSELEVSVAGDHVVLSAERPEDLIGSLNRLLRRYDPDILLTEWGDSFVLPRLLRLAQQCGQPLQLNRDRHAGIRTRRERSFVTYGKTMYTARAHFLHGRWHLDLHNSFIYTESELAGLLEISRLSRLPVQYQGRTSIGTAISSMQLNRAVRDGILVPWHKSEPEAFKTAEELLITDKGGLTYQPTVGVFEGVGELDFSSMYPMMMAKFNISPETVNCKCCGGGEAVPEIGYTICKRRRGLVPQILDHVLERRGYYKRRKNETSGTKRALYDQRQTALKWALVTSFGYLGYRNARYGRIEAHESTTAYSREMLLRAKELAESRGFQMLHALVDSMWLQKRNAAEAEYEVLARDIGTITNLPIYVEGVYSWIAFLPSKTHPGVGVPNRYMGVFNDGSTKIRGIEVRRGDTPVLVEEMQNRMLREMFQTATLNELRQRVPEVLRVLEETLIRLRSGEVTPVELALTATISQEPGAYKNNHPIALAARALDRSGIRLHPGEAVQYIVTDSDARLPDERVRPLALLGTDWTYDAERYAELLFRATETLLEPLGLNRGELHRRLGHLLRKEPQSASV